MVYKFFSEYWHALSRCGVDKQNSIQARRVVVVNRLSMIIGATALVSYLIFAIYILATQRQVNWMNTNRVLFIAFFSPVSVWLNYKGKHVLAKFLVPIVPTFFMIYYPVLLGRITLELYLFYAIFLIAFSSLLPLIFSYIDERKKLFTSLVLYLLLAMFTDELYAFFQTSTTFAQLIFEQYVVSYKLALISVFVFLNGILTYLLYVNDKYQLQLSVKSNLLEEKSQIVSDQNESLLAYKEELLAQNAELHAQQEEIAAQHDFILVQHDLYETQNTELKQSISYASRIQAAIMPGTDLLEEAFNQTFLFFKPKDVLSGDFFWTAKVGGRLIVAVADCTGHGIPGAMLSTLGISMLNEIIMLNKLLQPELILELLRLKIITALGRSQSSVVSQDGMDIGLCVFDFENKEVSFAGAFNPLVFIRDGELITIQPDRMPIGLYTDEELPFNAHTIAFKTNDVFYLFSDGFADQFGGLEQKKFKRKRFNSLLLRIHNLSGPAQYQALDETLAYWQGTNEQVDDITVVGMRI